METTTTDLSKAPEAVKAIPATNIVDLDVRPILQSGGEPFSEIMAAADKVPETNGALKLRATFEPKPLFRVLGGKGFKYWIEFGEGDDWMIWFYREGDASAEMPKVLDATLSQFPELPKRLKTSEHDWALDVREMMPPEPMEMTLAVLSQLPKEARLVQINQRVPQFLIPLLAERGLVHRVLKEEPNEVRIEIKHK